MNEVIIVAGENKVDVSWVRHCLWEQGYNSLPCKSVEQIIEELEVLPDCDAHVPLVIIDPRILTDVDTDMIARLSDCYLDVPILNIGGEMDECDEPADLFEQICEHRTRFTYRQNPQLADVLESAGVTIALS